MSLQSDIQLAYALADRESATSARKYLNHVVINSDPEPMRFAALAEPWQWARANYVLPAVESVTGHNPGYHGPSNLWETMPRGHDKTSFIGRLMNWVLVYSKRQLRLLVAAKDSEQANILKDFMKMEAELNPWFGNRLEFQQKIVVGPGGHLRIATADALGLFGHGIDIFVMEELTHWEDTTGQAVWTALWSGRRKRQSSILMVLSNAGYVDTWQHKIFVQAKESATTSKRWFVFEAPGMMASWMDHAAIEEERKMLPPVEARRLLDNKWVDPGEVSGYLTTVEVAALEAEARRRELKWTDKLDPALEYFLSIDYGPKRDRTVATLGHQEPTGGIIVDRMQIWQGLDFPPVEGASKGEVPIQVLYDWIDGILIEAPWLWLIVDPYQLKDLVQHYRGRIPVEEFEARGGKSNYEMAEVLRHTVVHKKLLWYPGAGDIKVGAGEGGLVDSLKSELTRLVLKVMTYGYRFDHLSGRHDDRACSLGMLCVQAYLRPRPAVWIQRQEAIKKPSTPDPWKNRGGGSRELWGTRV